MKNHLILFLLLFPILSFSQDFGLKAGYVLNRFYDTNNDETGYYSSDYKIGGGYNVEVDYEILLNKARHPFAFKFAVVFQQFNGAYNTRDGSMGGYTWKDVKINVSSLELDWYFLCFQPLKHLNLNIGTSIDYFLKQETKGTSSSFSQGVTTDTSINEIENNLFNWGFTSEIYYEIKIAESWFIAPRYRFYINIPTYSDSHQAYRQYLNIGVIKKIESKD